MNRGSAQKIVKPPLRLQKLAKSRIFFRISTFSFTGIDLAAANLRATRRSGLVPNVSITFRYRQFANLATGSVSARFITRSSLLFSRLSRPVAIDLDSAAATLYPSLEVNFLNQSRINASCDHCAPEQNHLINVGAKVSPDPKSRLLASRSNPMRMPQQELNSVVRSGRISELLR